MACKENRQLGKLATGDVNFCSGCGTLWNRLHSTELDTHSLLDIEMDKLREIVLCLENLEKEFEVGCDVSLRDYENMEATDRASCRKGRSCIPVMRAARIESSRVSEENDTDCTGETKPLLDTGQTSVVNGYSYQQGFSENAKLHVMKEENGRSYLQLSSEELSGKRNLYNLAKESLLNSAECNETDSTDLCGIEDNEGNVNNTTQVLNKEQSFEMYNTPYTDSMQTKAVKPVNELSMVCGRPTSPVNDVGVNSSRKTRLSHTGKPPLCPVSDLHISVLAKAERKSIPCLTPVDQGEDRMFQVGVCCEHCNTCLVDLKCQALQILFPDGNFRKSIKKDVCFSEKLEERLQVPEKNRKFLKNERCDVCDTHIKQLKKEAIVMVQSIQQAQTDSKNSANISKLVGSCNVVPHQRISQIPHSLQSRFSRPGKNGTIYQRSNSAPLVSQAHAYLDPNSRGWSKSKKYNQLVTGKPPFERPSSPDVTSMDYSSSPQNVRMQHGHINHSRLPTSYSWNTPPHSPHHSSGALSPGSSTGSVAAASFFARAAQKLSKSSKRRKQHTPDPELPMFPTNFCEVIRISPPPAPPCLLRQLGRLQNPGMGKVKVMLKINAAHGGNQGEQSATFLNVDPRKKQITLYDPSNSNYASPSHKRAGASAPKMFAFDSVFSPDDSLTEVCGSGLTEIVQSVVNGADGCLFTYGHPKTGKSFTMIGKDVSSQTLGAMPCAIAWLFRLINEQKDQTGARFSVRVSAVEVFGRNETLRDLLKDIAQNQEAAVATSPGMYLREDPICGTQLENQSELRAPTAEKAAYYLDAALASRTPPDEEDSRSSHMLFTLHVYQYRIEKTNNKAGLPGVAGGRSRLHLIDLGSQSKSKDPNSLALSLSSLGNVITALLNGQRHVPHRESKIAQLLRDSLGNLSCRTCMIVQVTSAASHYNETLQVIQLASRIYRMRRRKTKVHFSSTSSEDSSCDSESGRGVRRPFRGFRMGTLREDMLYSSSHSDPDYTSSSEQSCDTVIYVGSYGQSLSDREVTDNEGPPRSVPIMPRTNPRLPRRSSGSRSSGDEGSNSDSGRSFYGSDYRIAKQSMTQNKIETAQISKLPMKSSPVRTLESSPLCSGTPPMSPQTGMASHLRRHNLHTKSPHLSRSRHQTDTDDPSSQYKISKSKLKMRRPDPSTASEQWIDGPGAAIYNEGKITKEQWIDGPQAMVVKQPESMKGEHGKRLLNAKVNAEEMWIDGPIEMVAPPEQTTAYQSKMHTNSKIPRKDVDTKMQHVQTSDKVLKQSFVRQLQDKKDRPDSTLSVDSNVSLKAEAASSRPASFASNFAEETANVDGEMADEPVKPFVRDWVEKHSMSNSDSRETDSTNIGFILNADNQVIGTLESSESASKKPKAHDSKIPHVKTSSKDSPSVPRKLKAENLKSQKLPAPANPCNRVTEWLKSVSPDESVSDSKSDLAVPVMADAETNTEVDEEFGPLEETLSCRDEDTSSAMKEDVQMPAELIPTLLARRSDLDTNILNISHDSSSFENMEMNRESIYELQMDQQLEKSSNKNSGDIPDDETFSSVSFPKDGGVQEYKLVFPDACDVLESAMMMECDDDLTRSLTVQNLKELSEHSESAVITSALRTLTESPVISEYDNSNSQCLDNSISRKPDGASNPHLMKTFEEEEIDILSLKENYRILQTNNSFSSFCVASSQNDSIVSSDLPTTSSSFLSGGLCSEANESDISKGSVFSYNVQSIDSRESSPSKYALKSKPPLPQKITGRSSSVPKPSSVSSTSSLSCQSTPSPPVKHNHLKDQCKSKTTIPVSSHTSRSKDKDKSSKSNQRSSSLPSSGNSTSASTSCSVSTTKSSKSPSPARSMLPVFSSKNSQSSRDSKSKKKDKSCPKMSKINEITNHKYKGTDSDSGNDSGIVAHEKRLLSPYATVTKPRTPSHSSSGHGSDNSSTFSNEMRCKRGSKSEKLHGGASSGYESMLRDSEATGSSAGEESCSDELSDERKKGSKKKKCSRRSRSAPARSSESPDSGKSSPTSGKKGNSPTSKAWIDTRYLQKLLDEPFEMKNYDVDDIERLQKRRLDENEIRALEQRKEKIKELLNKQEESKELPASKELIIERSTWSFDCKLLMCFSCRNKKGTEV